MAARIFTIAVFNEKSGWKLPDALIDRVTESAPDGVVVRQADSRESLIELLAETHYLMGFPLVASQFIDAGPLLEWIQLTSPASETLAPIEEAISAGVRVTSAESIRAPHTAEHAIALTLALLRRLDLAMRAQMEHRWTSAKIAPLVRDLEGATVGLPGYGVVAEAIAQRMKGFGCQVLSTGHGAENALIHVDHLLEPNRLDELLARSDIVILSAPHGAGMKELRAADLEQMKPTSLLVDVGDGRGVRPADLANAMGKQLLAAAALDVFEHEPLVGDSPLWTMENVIITPHVSSASPRYWNRAVDLTCRNLKRIESGRDLIDELFPDGMTATLLSR